MAAIVRPMTNPAISKHCNCVDPRCSPGCARKPLDGLTQGVKRPLKVHSDPGLDPGLFLLRICVRSTELLEVTLSVRLPKDGFTVTKVPRKRRVHGKRGYRQMQRCKVVVTVVCEKRDVEHLVLRRRRVKTQDV